MTRRLTYTRKPLVSSILLWVRNDQPRVTGMNYWKGPHSKIISATPGFDEYRQIHLADKNPGLWPAMPGVETAIPADRKIDGIAEVTFRLVLAPLLGKKQTNMAHKDETNVFRRTLLYAGLPGASRWYDVADHDETVGARLLIYIRKKDGVRTRAFRQFIADEFVAALADTGLLKELRTQYFMPWKKQLWNTPNVAHDNPGDQRFHASITVGFTDGTAAKKFLTGPVVKDLSVKLPNFVAAIHAYKVNEALTYVKDGRELLRYQK